MLLSSAFRIGTVLLISVFISQIVPSFSSNQFDLSVFSTRAVNFCVTKTFLQTFEKFTLPLDGDVTDGSRYYNERKGDFEETGKSGIIIEEPVEKLNGIVKLWNKNSLISSEEATNMEQILSAASFKTVLEHVFVRDNGDVVYGTTAFVELAKTDSETRTGAIFYSFRKFKIPTPAVVTYKRANVDSGTCKLWGQFCPTTYTVDGLTDRDSQILFSYMRSETLKQFVEETRRQKEYIGTIAEQYKQFLPIDFSDSLTKMGKSPDTVPSELFAEDSFTINFKN